MSRDLPLPISLRSAASEKKYGLAKARRSTTPLEEIEPITSWKYWVLIENDFPYDIAYEYCHMLLTKEEAPDWDDLSQAAKDEYYVIRRQHLKASGMYSQILENCPDLRSYPGRFHFHAVKFYYSRELMKL